jgi:hypothetical protein
MSTMRSSRGAARTYAAAGNRSVAARGKWQDASSSASRLRGG